MAQHAMRERNIPTVFLAIVWHVLLVVSSAAIAADPVTQKQLTPQEKRITRLEHELQLLQQKYEAQQTALESATAALRVQNASLQALQSEGRKQMQLLRMLENNDPKLTDWLMVGVSAALLWLSVLVWRINKQIAWFTGAMESHSQSMLMLEAGKKDQITLKWWDPYFNGPKKEWPTKAQHNQQIELNEIYVGVPVNRRKKHPCRAKLKEWWSGVRDRVKGVRGCIASLFSKTKASESAGENTPDNKGAT
ncbi:hypothetical protein [Thiobacillus sp.]